MEVHSTAGAEILHESKRFIAGPVLRFAAVPLLALAFVILLVGSLNYFKFETTYEELAEQRIDIILDRAQSSIESAITLGLSLEDVGAAQSILDVMLERDGRIESAAIFDATDSLIVFASDAEAVGTKVDSDWLDAQARAQDGRWRLMLGGRVVIGARLDAGYAEGVGGIVLTYSLAEVQAETAALREGLAISMAAVFAIFAIPGVAGGLFLTRRYRRTVFAIHKALTGKKESEILPGDLRQAVEGFNATTSEVDRELRGFEGALHGDQALASARPAP